MLEPNPADVRPLEHQGNPPSGVAQPADGAPSHAARRVAAGPAAGRRPCASWSRRPRRAARAPTTRRPSPAGRPVLLFHGGGFAHLHLDTHDAGPMLCRHAGVHVSRRLPAPPEHRSRRRSRTGARPSRGRPRTRPARRRPAAWRSAATAPAQRARHAWQAAHDGAWHPRSSCSFTGHRCVAALTIEDLFAEGFFLTRPRWTGFYAQYPPTSTRDPRCRPARRRLTAGPALVATRLRPRCATRARPTRRLREAGNVVASRRFRLITASSTRPASAASRATRSWRSRGDAGAARDGRRER